MTDADLQSGNVGRAILKKTVSHPATTFPVALGGLALLWSVVIGPSEPAVLATLLGFVVGAGSWVVNYFIRGERLTAEYVQQLTIQLAQNRKAEFQKLVTDCDAADFTEGGTEASELIAAFNELRDYLMAAKAKGNHGVEQYLALAHDAFHQGIAVLRKALGTFQALQRIDLAGLEKEVRAWKKQLASSEKPEALQRRIDSNEATIRSYRKYEAELQDALAESNGLEQAMKVTLLDLTRLSSVGDGETLVQPDGEAENRLLQAVQAAKRVEDRLTKLGQNDTSADDQVYLEAGKRSQRQ